MRKIFPFLLVSLLTTAPFLSHAQDRTYFRYKNDQGVQVMSDVIPVKYANKGYQIVDIYGRVVREIPPELSSEEKERLRKEMEEKRRLEVWDKELLARYTRTEDIEAAKKRKLRGIDTNIFTLRLTLNNISDKIKTLQADAAANERQGVEVPEDLLVSISQLQEDQQLIEEEIQQKLKDKDDVTHNYNKDIERFNVIRPPK